METNKLENKSGILVSGGILASLIASICCIGPLILTLLGISGAAILAKFEFLRLPMILLVLVLFGVAGFALYRKRISCEEGSICSDPKRFKKMIIFYWTGLVISIIGISSPWWVTIFFS